MRHGPAEDRAPSGRDFDRALTRAGREVARSSAHALHRAREAAALRVVSSPYRRARETAEVLAALVGRAEIEIHEDLGADRDLPLSLVRDIHAAGEDAILVGHQPVVEELVRTLSHPQHASLPSGFRTALIVALAHTSGAWSITDVIDPHATR